MTEKDRWEATPERLQLIRLAIDAGPVFLRWMVTRGIFTPADAAKLTGLLDPPGRGRPSIDNSGKDEDQKRLLRQPLLDRLAEIRQAPPPTTTHRLKGQKSPREIEIEQLCSQLMPAARKQLIAQKQQLAEQYEQELNLHYAALLSQLEDRWQDLHTENDGQYAADSWRISPPPSNRTALELSILAEKVETLMGNTWRPTPRKLKNLLGWK